MKKKLENGSFLNLFQIDLVKRFIMISLCKMRIFVQNQGMRKILPQTYTQYSKDKILSKTQSLGKKIILQEAHDFFYIEPYQLKRKQERRKQERNNEGGKSWYPLYCLGMQTD
jgi:hypothetical protein